MKNTFRKTIIAAAAATVFITAQSFQSAGEEPVASKTRITNGQTAGVTNVTEFNAGEEIYVCIPLTAPLGDKFMIHVDEEGKELLYDEVLAYTAESKLQYLSFALAIDPKNHRPEQYFYKEGHYKSVLKLLANLPAGKHQIAFGIGKGSSTSYAKGGKFKSTSNPGQIFLTVNITEEGRKVWKQWVDELEKMDKQYEERLK